MKHESSRTLENDLDILLEMSRSRSSLSIMEIVGVLSGKGRALIIIFLSLPFCQPIQIPGVSILFGIIIAFMGLRIAFGRHVWLPKKMLSKTVHSKEIQKVAQKCLQLMKKMKRFVYPRMCWLSAHGTMQIFNGLLIFMLGIFLALPLPIPFTNLAAGWSILLLSLGMLEDDGVFVLLGYFVSLFTVILFATILLAIRLYTETS